MNPDCKYHKYYDCFQSYQQNIVLLLLSPKNVYRMLNLENNTEVNKSMFLS